MRQLWWRRRALLSGSESSLAFYSRSDHAFLIFLANCVAAHSMPHSLSFCQYPRPPALLLASLANVACRSVCLSACLSACLPCLSACLSVCLSVCLPACLFVCLAVCLSVWLAACLSVCLSICLSVYLSACLFVCLSVCLSVCVSVCLSVCVSPTACPRCIAARSRQMMCFEQRRKESTSPAHSQ